MKKLLILSFVLLAISGKSFAYYSYEQIKYEQSKGSHATFDRVMESPSIRFHDLRHTYASTLIIQQVPLPYISKQLGHSTNKVTLDTYVHLMPESAQLGDSLLENLYEEKGAGLEESNVRMFGT